MTLGRGHGWMGHTPWWVPKDDSVQEIRQFVKRARDLLDGLSGPGGEQLGRKKPETNSPSAAGDAYLRYVEAYEVRITPRHSTLQARYERFLASVGATEFRPNVASVDLRYRDPEKGVILAEIKPCDPANARYAVRTAMGQLLDYRQRAKEDTWLMIVLEEKPKEEDRLLATSNGFGIAFPSEDAFEVFWPAIPIARPEFSEG